MKLIVYLKRLMKLVMDPKPVKFGAKGDNVVIEPHCKFGFSENIEIGNNVKIGEGTCIFAQGGCVIKDGTILADKVDIRTANHHYDGDDLEMLPFDEKIEAKKVVIEENVWVASNVIILPGVTIGEGAVIAAGAIVTKDVPPLAVMGGNPAKVIKYRNSEKYQELKNSGKQYMALQSHKYK